MDEDIVTFQARNYTRSESGLLVPFDAGKKHGTFTAPPAEWATTETGKCRSCNKICGTAGGLCIVCSVREVSKKMLGEQMFGEFRYDGCSKCGRSTTHGRDGLCVGCFRGACFDLPIGNPDFDDGEENALGRLR